MGSATAAGGCLWPLHTIHAPSILARPNCARAYESARELRTAVSLQLHEPAASSLAHPPPPHRVMDQAPSMHVPTFSAVFSYLYTYACHLYFKNEHNILALAAASFAWLVLVLLPRWYQRRVPLLSAKQRVVPAPALPITPSRWPADSTTASRSLRSIPGVPVDLKPLVKLEYESTNEDEDAMYDKPSDDEDSISHKQSVRRLLTQF